MFSDSDSESEDLHQLTINEHYAKAFEYRKEREELAKLKEKYGSDAEDVEEEDDSEEDETEDEDGEELTPAVDAAILRTLARIKRRDPAIYEHGKDVYEEEKAKTGDTKITKRPKQDEYKPLTLRQHALASVLEPESHSPSPKPLTYVQEQEALKKETVHAFHDAVNDDDDDDLLVLREKTKDEVEKEEEEYKEFLKREVGQDLKELITIPFEEEDDVIAKGHSAEDEGTETKQKKGKKKKIKDSRPKYKEEDQQFLFEYILNRGWIDKDSRRLPTYKEIVSSSKKTGHVQKRTDFDDDSDDRAGGNDPIVTVEDDEEFEDIADRFESSYNFRFEEADAADIVRHPRNISSGVRREDTTRKEARERRRQRKEDELLQKREEVKRLKALKLKELRGKLEKIGREGGRSLEDDALRILDLDADWDPDTHDRQMTNLYTQEDEDGPVEDDQKPTWDDDIDITDIAPDSGPVVQKTKKGKKKKKSSESDIGDNGVFVDEMDADAEKRVVSLDEDEWDGTEETRKKVLDKYMDELYEMEFNDLVGGMPTRFHYTSVQPTSYALTPVEILLSTDAELNQYMGIKKYAPYIDKKREGWDHSRNTRLGELKQKLKTRQFGSERYDDRAARQDGEAGPSGEGKRKKRKGKKERMKLKAVEIADEPEPNGDEHSTWKSARSSTTKRKLHAEDEETLEQTVQTSEGPSKKRRRHHKKPPSAPK